MQRPQNYQRLQVVKTDNCSNVHTSVPILVETAETTSEINVKRAQKQLAANALDLNHLWAEAALARAQNRIKVASNV